jgi:hypothetical protein
MERFRVTEPEGRMRRISSVDEEDRPLEVIGSRSHLKVATPQGIDHILGMHWREQQVSPIL